MCLVDHIMTKWLCLLAVGASSCQREASVMTQRASHQEQNILTANSCINSAKSSPAQSRSSS